MIGRIAAVAAALVMAAPAPGAAKAPPAAPGKGRYGTLSVVSAGSGNSLRFGMMMLGLPFGAELMDGISLGPVYRLGATDLYLVKGSRAGKCPARFVIVAVDADRDPSIAGPFGSCAPLASAAVTADGLIMTMAAGPGGGQRQFLYAGGRVRALPVPDAAAQHSGGGGTCRLYTPATGSPGEAERLLASFRAGYPRALSSRGKVERATLPSDLPTLVTGLACLATWPGAQDVVPDRAMPLFASRRYGEQAFATLDKIGRAPDAGESLRAAARSFAARMRFEVARF